ncbi:MAG: class I SAM-dependent methyltransferase [Anaerolineae bacterium]
MSVFDALAEGYDADFTTQPIGRILRQRIHSRLTTHFRAGMRVLEIGCGTGEDALFLAERGVQVIATDASAGMIEVTTRKTQHNPLVSVHLLDLNHLKAAFETGILDGAFSNFGVLNCITDWQPLAQWLSQRIRSGGIVGFGVMAPYCLWELLWHIGHWRWDIALRRVRGDQFGTLTITYPTIKRLTADFAPHFQRVHVSPLGVFLPTTALFDVVQKRPRLMHRLTQLEERVQDQAWLASFADHYWIEFERY